MRAGLITHTHSSGAPLPLPIRVSSGFLVIGLSGNTRIHTLPPRLTWREMAIRAASICRAVKRGGKVWIRVFPDKPITKKPLETRMGKGKGNPEEWVAVVRPARILYELEGVTPELAEEAMRLAAHKLPIKTRFVTRHDELR